MKFVFLFNKNYKKEKLYVKTKGKLVYKETVVYQGISAKIICQRQFWPEPQITTFKHFLHQMWAQMSTFYPFEIQ